MADNPYQSLPEYCFWRRSIANVAPASVDPVVRAKFRIKRSDRIATAGSCFAQEIARYLPGLGLRYLVSEPGPERLTPDERRRWQYGTFSARYGNIYTTTQWRQLFERATGRWQPQDDHWRAGDGRFVDPYRPTVEPGGYATLDELRWDRERHLAAVRRLMREASVFVFTLGLTESWRDKRDGAVFPLCPGCGYGSFDPERHAFHNLTVDEVVADLEACLRHLKAENPAVRLVLTVSPVPLVATMSGRHVLAATTYSKSVLRIAAETFVGAHADRCYFPSYEIITGAHARGRYFHDDLRAVTREGVEHVMRCFAGMLVEAPTVAAAAPPVAAAPDQRAQRRRAEALVSDVICDEETLVQSYHAG